MLGDVITELRKKNKLTQIDVSKKLNILQSSYSKYENNQRQPDYETLKNIAELYDVSTDYLLERKQSKANPLDRIKNNLTNEQKQKLIELCTLLYPEIIKDTE